MVSRMEKYYKNNSSIKQRSQKNRELYRNIYDIGEYSNIEGIATMEKNNEIDITKVRNTIKNRENYKRQKQYRQITNPKIIENEEISEDFTSNEQKNYDIRDILNKAKNNNNIDNSHRSLDNTNYNILKNLKFDNNDKTKHKDFEDDELKGLIDTITNTSVLHQMNDKELGLDILELGATSTVINNDNNSIKKLLDQAKKYEEKKQNTIPEIDNSFYTSSLNFSKEDFEEANAVIKKKKTKKILPKILLFVGLIIITGLIIFGVYCLIK